ncbi:hypothetical protein C8R46DRAFT_1108930 [Mycena filopes]|nr:hypothetical protein C8R46DRAFT_1108930 [Mycena filopes]
MNSSPIAPQAATVQSVKVGAPAPVEGARDRDTAPSQCLCTRAVDELPFHTTEESTRIVNAIGEQTASFKMAFEKLVKVIEAGQPRTQATDRKTTFWTLYKSLGDEFDGEFQAKYGGDLDTALIFAGLFSAVSSAFIIQIQPELQPDPNATTQAAGTSCSPCSEHHRCCS